jgi:hypothetical protein
VIAKYVVEHKKWDITFLFPLRYSLAGPYNKSIFFLKPWLQQLDILPLCYACTILLTVFLGDMEVFPPFTS